MVVKPKEIQDIFVIYSNKEGQKFIDDWTDGMGNEFGGILNILLGKDNQVYYINGVEEKFDFRCISDGKISLIMSNRLDNMYNKNIILKKDNKTDYYIYSKDNKNKINIEKDKTIYNFENLSVIRTYYNCGHLIDFNIDDKYCRIFFDGKEKIINEQEIINNIGNLEGEFTLNDVYNLVKENEQFNRIMINISNAIGKDNNEEKLMISCGKIVEKKVLKKVRKRK